MSSIYSTLSFAGISIVLALSCFLLLKAGEISFGQQAFFGLGAYSAASLTTLLDWPLPAALVLSALLGAVLALLVSLPLMRLTGFRFTLTTLIMAEFIRELLVRFEWTRVAGGRIVGAEGVLGFSGIDYYYNHQIDPLHQSVIVLAIALGCASLLAVYLKSRLGLELVAVASDSRLAASVAINTQRVRRTAFAIAGGLASLGGGLFAHHATYVDASNFGIMMGVHAIAYVLIGGVANVVGPIVGTLVDVLILEWLRVFGPFRMVAFGILLVAVLALRPGGIISSGTKQ